MAWVRSDNCCRVGGAFYAVLLSAVALVGPSEAEDQTGSPAKVLRAGAVALDIAPQQFPVIVNGMFEERTADRVADSLHARALVLDDGDTRIAIVVVDSCALPRDLIDAAKELATQATGIPADRILISATHTHSAPSSLAVLGSRADENYVAFLIPQLARAVEQAASRLEPARVGWTAIDDREHTHSRRWIRRPDRVATDPFGDATMRANMHPGHQNPDYIGPSGPVDPALSILSVQTLDGRPLAILANYSMHYYGAPLVSSDYYGRFAEQLAQLVAADLPENQRKKAAGFVAMMSQGTSGDLMWPDYSQPTPRTDIDAYAAAVANVAFKAYQGIEYRNSVPLRMEESLLTIGLRVPSPERRAWAKQIVAGIQGRPPQGLVETYARENALIAENESTELKIQAIRIGELGIVALPAEVFAISGLKIKAKSPLETTFVIGLANGIEAGYIPPPAQHTLGGYVTWATRVNRPEVQAEPKMVARALELLEQLAERPQRKIEAPATPYVEAVLASKPIAYWRLDEYEGPQAQDDSGHGQHALYEERIAFHLDGPVGPGLQTDRWQNSAPHFAEGRLAANLNRLGGKYSVEFWFCNGLPADARLVTGYLFSRGPDGAEGAVGDHLAIGGTVGNAGKLVFCNGNSAAQLAIGRTEIGLKTWQHVVLVRDGSRVTLFLNGVADPEISGEATPDFPPDVTQVFFGGRDDNFANFAGKLDEVSVYDRPLTAEEAGQHYRAAVGQ